MAKRGRTTKYKDEYVAIAERVCSECGVDDKKLAKILGISVSTLNNWKKDYPEFLESIKRGKDEFDTTVVEASLLDRATGYSHPDLHISNYRGKITKTKITKHYPPDVTAQIFWLKNRNPERWRDKQDVKHEFPEGSGVLVVPAAVDKNQWQKQAAENQSQNGKANNNG